MMGDGRVLMGVIGRPHGVRGLMHVHSYTADPGRLAAYGPFSDDRGRSFGLRWHSEGVAALHEIVGGKRRPVADRASAETLVNTRLYIARDRLPPPEPDEFYLADLVGLAAYGADGAVLGTVSAVHDYGAGTSLEIGSALIPFTRACVPVVDIAAGRLVVQPPAEILAPGDAP